MMITIGAFGIEIKRTWTAGGFRRGIGFLPGWGRYVSRSFYLVWGERVRLWDAFSGKPGGWCRKCLRITFLRRMSEETYRAKMGFHIQSQEASHDVMPDVLAAIEKIKGDKSTDLRFDDPH